MSSIGSTGNPQREQIKTKMDDSGFDSFKENNKKTKPEHQKAGKIIQNQKYLNKGKRFSANNKARGWPSPTG